MKRRNFIELTAVIGMVNMVRCSSENDTEKKSEPMGEQEINTLAQKPTCLGLLVWNNGLSRR